MNLPNKLTLLRIVLVPFFLFFMLTDFVPHTYLWALIIFAVASYTDLLDGKLARKNGLVTDFGKLMDPLADKILVAAALISFIKLDSIPCVIVIIVIFREFLVTSLRLIAVEKGKVIAADIWGKAKTVFQICSIIWVLVALEVDYIGWLPEAFPLTLITTIIMWIMAALTVISGANYIIKNRNLIENM